MMETKAVRLGWGGFLGVVIGTIIISDSSTVWLQDSDSHSDSDSGSSSSEWNSELS